jgi:hypothetical protein
LPTSKPIAPLYAIAAAALILLLLTTLPADSATVFSTGYMINTAGGVASNDFIVQASGTPVPVVLYFSNSSLSKYFYMYSSDKNWNGKGFTTLSGTAKFTLESSDITDESLFFQNHTIWVEIGGQNHTIAFFILPSTFFQRGRDPPGGVPVGSATRQAVMERQGIRLPVEVSVGVW